VTFLTKLKSDGIQGYRIFGIGLLFGLALGPCAFAFMAPVLTLAFSLAKTGMLMAVFIMLAYGIGHCLVIIVGGTSVSLVQKILNWNEGHKGISIIKKICAIMVIAAGVYLIFK
jgi:cytochrome c-type biogenesis protein